MLTPSLCSFDKNSLDYALDCDAKDPLKEFQNEFLFPPPHVHNQVSSDTTINGSPSDSSPSSVLKTVERSKCIYLCGNSLGLQPKGRIILYILLS